ncbi:VOC family protein [Microlunatus sp. GCM10028923]|uniref:VOC family protein n=1 Tax=Microlunatus sp. GCM10028923 TaxID=3273400 RepID=UPI003614E291
MATVKHGKICYLFMPSQDVERSGAFYRAVFDWNVRVRDDGSAAFDDSTGQVSGTWVTDRPPATEGSLELHIMVDDLDRAIASIRELGGSVDEADIHADDARWAVFGDPDGNRLGIYEHPSGS